MLIFDSFVGKRPHVWPKVAVRGGRGRTLLVCKLPPTVPQLAPPFASDFITTPEIPDARKSLISGTGGMREGCDVMAGAPGCLVPLILGV